MSDEITRVTIWNTFFKLTWEQAKLLFETSTGKKSLRTFEPAGGTRPVQEFHQLATLVLCNLAIEARANHLIEELREKGTIPKDVAEAEQRRPTKYKWFRLPVLAGTSTTLASDKWPHQAISEICSPRNNLFHVNYAGLKKVFQQLPPGKTISLFKGFVKAMENMNVVLERIPEEREEVLKIGCFD